MRDSIHLNGVRCFAHHGCLDEEGIIGAEFQLDLKAYGNFHSACDSDDLHETIDYVTLYHISVREIKKRSKLIEHVAQRISDALFAEVPIIDELEILLKKVNPPIQGDVANVAVEIHRKRAQ